MVGLHGWDMDFLVIFWKKTFLDPYFSGSAPHGLSGRPITLSWLLLWKIQRVFSVCYTVNTIQSVDCQKPFNAIIFTLNQYWKQTWDKLKSFRGQISGVDISAYWEFYFCYQRCPTSAKFPQSVSARPRLISCLIGKQCLIFTLGYF